MVYLQEYSRRKDEINPFIRTWTLTILYVNASIITRKEIQMSPIVELHTYCSMAKQFVEEVKMEKRFMLWPRKGSLMKTQTRILDSRLYYTRKIELHRKGKKSRTVRITPILICPSGSKISALITVRRVHYSKMGKLPEQFTCVDNITMWLYHSWTSSETIYASTRYIWIF